MPCDLPVLKPNTVVVVTDAFSKKADRELFDKLPEHLRYKVGHVECKGKIEEALIPVASIKVSTFDDSGKLVEKEKATNMLIEYFDKNGAALEVVKMSGK
jgi:hypothetical protein